MMLMRECGKRIRLNVYYGFATQNWIFAAIFASIPAILAASLTNPYLLNSVGMGILALFILIMVSEKHPIAFKPAIKLKNMTDKIPVSVIIPCYNCKNTILRALNSVVTQTQKPQEIILINDGSQDETGEIIKNFQLKFGEKWIKNINFLQNNGPSYARNAGWDAAVCPYIAFLDADDSWHPEKLAIQYNYMNNHHAIAMSGHRCVVLKDNSSISYRLPKKWKIKAISKSKFIFISYYFATRTVMLKRNIDCRFPEDMRYSEDAFYGWNHSEKQ